MRKLREKLRDERNERNISAYEGWNALNTTQPYTKLILGPYFLLWIE